MTDLLALKRRWLPLFFAGAAFFGAGLALFLLWAYRSSPLVDVVVGLATTPARGIPPRGTLISLTAALFTAIGGAALIVAVRRINASEIGEIDSFWHKVAVAALAGRWWLAEPRVVVLVGDATCLPLLRGLKSVSGRLLVLAPPDTPRAVLIEMLISLAEDEDEVRQVVRQLERAGPTFDVPALSAALRLRGRIDQAAPLPRVIDAIRRAEAILFSAEIADGATPTDLDPYLRTTRARKIVVLPPTDEKGEATTLALLAARIGPLDAALVNSNTVPPLVEGQRYLRAPEPGRGLRAVVARDLVDWDDPARHNASKLAVFLREVILRE